MILTYEGKKTEDEILNSIKNCKLKSIKGNSEHKSKLIKGENLEVLKHLLNEGGLKGKVDLIFKFSQVQLYNLSVGNELLGFLLLPSFLPAKRK